MFTVYKEGKDCIYRYVCKISESRTLSCMLLCSTQFGFVTKKLLQREPASLSVWKLLES